MKEYVKCFDNFLNETKLFLGHNITEEDYIKNLNLIYGSEIPIAEYIGTMRNNYCWDNAWKMKKEYDLYTGILLYQDTDENYWWCTDHAFNVKDNKVYEFTKLSSSPIGRCHYFGKKYTGKLNQIDWVSERDNIKFVKI